MSLFGEKQKVFYRVLIADMYEGPKWATWQTHDTQQEAYEAIAYYRESYPAEKRCTPLRLVRIVVDPSFEVMDETFIDEVGVGLEEWKRMLDAGEVEWE